MLKIILPIAPLLIATILFFSLAHKLYDNGSNNDLENFALDQQTSVYYASNSAGDKIHCSDLTDLNICLDSWEKRGKKPIFLWFGNSQLHAINQMENNSINSTEYLSDMLDSFSSEVITFSQPNANIQEHELLFYHLTDKFNVSGLLLSLVYDDTRETGIRPTLRLTFDAETKKVSDKNLSEDSFQLTKEDNIAMEGSYQQFVEDFLVDRLDSISEDWSARSSIRANLTRNLYLFRNSLFNINSQTKRRKIPGRYQDNLKALEQLLSFSHEKNIHTIVYIAPLRSDIETPYIQEDYLKFKNETKDISELNHAVFLDLQDLVPSEYWGVSGSQRLGGDTSIDFMHFQEEGHRLLAIKILSQLKKNQLISN